MKLSEIAGILGIEVIDVITFDQSLMDNKTVRDAVKVVDATTLESFEIDNREAQFIIVAYAEVDPHNAHGWSEYVPLCHALNPRDAAESCALAAGHSGHHGRSINYTGWTV